MCQKHINSVFVLQDMVVNGTDYTFTSVTGSPTMKYGESQDCNGISSRDPCPHFGNATIDTRGTGLIVDPSVRSSFILICLIKSPSVTILNFIQYTNDLNFRQSFHYLFSNNMNNMLSYYWCAVNRFQTTFGLIAEYYAEMKDFRRSADGTQLSFLCAGFCGWCGPTSGPIKLLLSTEFSKLIFVNLENCRKWKFKIFKKWQKWYSGILILYMYVNYKRIFLQHLSFSYWCTIRYLPQVKNVFFKRSWTRVKK